MNILFLLANIKFITEIKNKQNNDLDNLELVEGESHKNIHKKEIRERISKNALAFLGILFIGTFGSMLIASFIFNGINLWNIGLILFFI